jgi:mono/diheme cytochrome c family protein
MKKLSVLLIIAAVVIFAGSSFDYSTETVADKSETILLPQDPADAKFPEGAKIYKEKCVVCHQVTGEGVPGAFPPLKNSDYLLADKKRAVAQVLNGSNEAMVVNGMTYTVPMPPQVESLEEAVQVINYVLNAWGNEGGTVSMDEVSDIKKVR